LKGLKLDRESEKDKVISKLLETQVTSKPAEVSRLLYLSS
jgi:hypothetical protein